MKTVENKRRERRERGISRADKVMTGVAGEL